MSENITACGLKKKAFLAAFRQTGNVRLACEAAQVGRSTHYRWLEADAAYEEAFELAKEDAADILEAEATRRAVEGVKKPTGWYKGKAGGYVREFSDTLLIFLLKGLRPKVYRERVEVRGLLGKLNLNLLPNHLIARIAAGEHIEAVLASGASDAGITPSALVAGALAPGPPPGDSSPG